MSRSTCAVLIAVVLLVASTWWVRFNGSTSAPRGLYWLSAVPVDIERGALVMIHPPPSVQHVWAFWVPILKPVAGVHGDTVCIVGEPWEHKGKQLYVDDVDYGPIERLGYGPLLLALHPGCHLVPEGMVFLASPAPRSLDGRYFGMTPVGTLSATATPIFTWKE